MKNQYFGDINDYRKYGLLRILQSTGNLKLLVAWMLTSNDSGPDGGFRSYLQHPGTWMRYDPELFTGLADLLRSNSIPSVSLIENSALLPRTSYYSIVVPDASKEREAWHQGLLVAAREIDLVFVDPDNGIEIPSKPIGYKGSSKYVTWEEIRGLWEMDRSILIYQHFRRERRAAFAERMLSELRTRTGAEFIEVIRTAHVMFILACQEGHRTQLQKAISLLSQTWRGQIEPM